ncbi:WhiB family transcriptional regulator [Streptomyces sp. NPDC095817]|uniref:WhiB family transcriptional regulator n=1 Tax=Streptomyces sp. NPDC095817 TaxID=3155082 RepID=UPI00331D28D7
MESTRALPTQRTPQPALAPRAKCRNNREAFDFERETLAPDVATQRIQEAKTICGYCPIAEECLRYALTHRDQARGIWAATTGPERGALRRRLKSRIGANWAQALTPRPATSGR